MEFFIRDTQIRIAHAKKELEEAKNTREKKIITKKIQDLELLSEVLQDIHDRNRNEMPQEKVLKM